VKARGLGSARLSCGCVGYAAAKHILIRVTLILYHLRKIATCGRAEREPVVNRQCKRRVDGLTSFVLFGTDYQSECCL
jgi:hypothetical protein